MSEHLDRLNAMLDHKQQTWDLSPNDIAAIQWAVDEISRLNDLYGRAAECYGGICRSLDESGKRNEDLECKVNLLESALRGEQGVEFDDGYSVNVSQLHDECERLRSQLREVVDLVDDVLYDPTFHPVDVHGKPIKGNEFYLVDHPVMDDHVPALRAWFVKQQGH